MDWLETIDAEQEKKIILKEYRRLLKSVRNPLTPSEKKQIRLAFEMANDAHSEMRRKSGEPYILHPLAVAHIVASEIGLGATAIICALLHDVVEDTEVSLEDIQLEFGKKVADIIDGLTKISGVFDLKSSIQAENFRKLLLTLATDVRVILIKCADRLHNMRTMSSMPRDKQLKISSETLFLYSPLAHRLGLYAVKSELEDLSLKFTQRTKYQEIASKLQATKRERTRYISEFTKPIKEKLKLEGLEADVFGRPKSISSIYNKMKNKNVEFEEVYDLFAIRIILNSPSDKEKSDSWKAYSIVTDSYQPNPDRLRDWVSTPKSNGYESLHTTVMGPRGRWVEVQIRSKRMDEIAERGFAAHWKYKEGSSDSGLDEWLKKIREILQNPEANALDFLNDFRLNLFHKEIYVFTPKGELKIVPHNATALDFAYDIHTDIGNTCLGAKVNHKLVPLSQQLNNGDQVEIITSKKQKPNEDWLNFVVTARARSKVKQALKEERKKQGSLGREMLERKFGQLKAKLDHDAVDALMVYYGMETALELYSKIGDKKINLQNLKSFKVDAGHMIIPKEEVKQNAKKTVDQEESREEFRKTLKKKEELLIFGESADKINYEFAVCCNPISGDDVFGFISLSGKIKVHRTNCPNAVNMMSKYGYRVVKTKWTARKDLAFLTELKIIGLDDVGTIHEMTNIISGEMKLNMQSMSMDSNKGVFEGRIQIYVNNTDVLEALIVRLKRMNGIHSVSRTDA